MYLSEKTFEKYAQGYRKANTFLSSIEMEKKKETRKEPCEPGFTSPENLQWYTVRQCNLLITHRVAEKVKKPPKKSIQTGQANRQNGLPYARIYTSTETGRNYVVFTGY